MRTLLTNNRYQTLHKLYRAPPMQGWSSHARPGFLPGTSNKNRASAQSTLKKFSILNLGQKPFLMTAWGESKGERTLTALYSEAKKLVKIEIDPAMWKEFGITDKR